MTNSTNNYKFDIVTLMLLLLFLCFGVFSCQQNRPEKTISNPLYIDPATQDFSENPALLERILSGPHGYLRFINIPFSQEICHRFNSWLVGTPSFNLHGDAHIEQYAVTDLGRGLTDYDDSSIGPAVIDWMRFGVSLHLACNALEWQKHSSDMFDEFLRGYREALNFPETIAPEPTIAKRIRSKFTINRENYFKWVDSVMEPMPDEERYSLLIALQPYVETLLAEKPNLNRNFYSVVQTGYLKMGIGSALDIKYLVRVQGKTTNPADDIVLECKEVRDLSGIDCIQIGQKTDPFRILLGHARIAYQPFDHLGYFSFRGLNFWVHSWVDNYKEVVIGESFQSPQELYEVVYDVGVQLGKGHVKHIAAPLDLQLRRQQLQILDKHEGEIKQARLKLAELVVSAWKEFCSGIDKK